MSTKKSPESKNQKLAKRYRTTVCSGCHYNYYNTQHAGDGWNAPSRGEGCWFLDQIKRGKCSHWHR